MERGDKAEYKTRLSHMTCLCQMVHMRLRLRMSSVARGGGVKMVIMGLVSLLEKITDD